MKDTDYEIRLKRLKYRANHRGIKEMDILLGSFADDCLEKLSSQEIDQFEALMGEHDRDLLVWFTGEAPFPIKELETVFDMIAKHNRETIGNG